jgi:hypothetical protein
MFLATTYEVPSYLSKKDVIKYPLFGPCAVGLQSIFLEREVA